MCPGTIGSKNDDQEGIRKELQAGKVRLYCRENCIKLLKYFLYLIRIFVIYAFS